jgi:hypothetical protein
MFPSAKDAIERRDDTVNVLLVLTLLVASPSVRNLRDLVAHSPRVLRPSRILRAPRVADSTTVAARSADLEATRSTDATTTVRVVPVDHPRLRLHRLQALAAPRVQAGVRHHPVQALAAPRRLAHVAHRLRAGVLRPRLAHAVHHLRVGVPHHRLARAVHPRRVPATVHPPVIAPTADTEEVVEAVEATATTMAEVDSCTVGAGASTK